jgi:peptidoglycan/LPS O-acetylase OafA/YrhL
VVPSDQPPSRFLAILQRSQGAARFVCWATAIAGVVVYAVGGTSGPPRAKLRADGLVALVVLTAYAGVVATYLENRYVRLLGLLIALAGFALLMVALFIVIYIAFLWDGSP